MSQITSHILDTSVGKPAAGIPVTLSTRSTGHCTVLGSGITDSDGRVRDFLDDDVVLPEGIYCLKFETEPYFASRSVRTFYPHVEIVFHISADGQHYHVPLLLNPFGYSTYRGS